MKPVEKIKYALIGGILSTGILLGAFAWAASSTLSLATLSELTQIFTYIKSYYVDEVDDKELIHSAIDGMLTELDPHSNFLRPKAYEKLKVSTKGHFGGLGIEVNLSDEGYVKVIAPIDDTPAFKQDVRAGDLIVRLDGKPVKGMTLSEAVDVMRGKIGDPIVISILRDGERQLIDKTIIRDRIDIQSVRSKLLEPYYGYVRISRFQGPTAQQLEKHIDQLMESQTKLEGLVVDLRNNPGGLLDSAVQVSSAFLDGDLVVSTKGRIKGSDQSYHAASGQRLEGVPVVVLINEGSASASEIVAGALQDSKRALIMGRNSFGKGSVQSILDLKNSQAAVKLTTAKYYTPSGKTIQAKGIVPDIEIPLVKIEAIDDNRPQVTEKDLLGHIENEEQAQSTQTHSTASSNTLSIKEYQPIGSAELLKTDYELYLALNALRSSALQNK